jgi:hypothetical protein
MGKAEAWSDVEVKSPRLLRVTLRVRKSSISVATRSAWLELHKVVLQ